MDELEIQVEELGRHMADLTTRDDVIRFLRSFNAECMRHGARCVPLNEPVDEAFPGAPGSAVDDLPPPVFQ